MKTTIPVLKRRAGSPERLAAAETLGLPPVVTRVLAARAEAAGVEPAWLLDLGLGGLDSPAGLPDIDAAAARIARAVTNGERIALETDHDVDGQTAHALFHRALVDGFGHPPERVQSYIGHRLTEGYGLSDGVCNRILAAGERPDLVITADNGSSDVARIQRLQAAGIDVVVTDHHELPAEGPPPALACVNPTRPDSAYPDPLIAGVAVAWLVIAHTRQYLPPERAEGLRLSALLDLVALGTVADCVSLSRSRNNRIFIDAGLRIANAADARPCWAALREPLRARERPFTAQDLAFGAGPRLNARGRLDEAMAGVHFLLAETREEADRYAALLEQENTTRKGIEAELKRAAMAAAEPQFNAGRTALVVNFAADGHAGIHGIVASRLVEHFGRPAACLSAKADDPALLTGSLRGIPGVHVRDALQRVADHHPDLFTAFGGHAGAAGCTLPTAELDRFSEALDAAFGAQLAGEVPQPVRETDGPLPVAETTLETARALEAIAPYGREFPEAVFEVTLRVEEVRVLGAAGEHLKLRGTPMDDGAGPGRPLSAIWFNATEEAPEPGSVLDLFAVLEVNRWNGREDVQLRITGRRPAGEAVTPRCAPD